ncbi:hypothetical protein GOC74_02080 [Halomicrobium mukohataei]|uniref:Uncharacterized protein n=1 Tax=Halomicrobium mukohataei TaxID=57705 RepID=A0A847U831_9EURY|nr:hypothetical protein [Halomicrobium mukohataei]NLV08726.1 hypothetical protein [Halomicrobium mukohataei]
MASSNPSIQSASIPSEVPPNDTFTVDVTVRQGEGPDPWGSTGGCTSSTLDPTGWVTPVSLWVDGDLVDTRKLCLANNNSKDTQFSLSLSAGSHTVEVAVHQVGDVIPAGQGWRDNLSATEYDDVRETVSTTEDAPDPSRPSTGDRITRLLDSLSDSLGASTTQIGFGIAIAVVVLVVL